MVKIEREEAKTIAWLEIGQSDDVLKTLDAGISLRKEERKKKRLKLDTTERERFALTGEEDGRPTTK